VDEVLGGLECEVAADRARAASCGRVAPTIVRTTAIALGPSKAAATSGLDVMKSTSPPKNGFSRWTA
jgi:hypothetical protein